MSRPLKLIAAMAICGVLLMRHTQAENAENNSPDGDEKAAVTIVLTKLDVNDQNLNLSWKITNNTEHDVWVCGGRNFEWFMDKDAKTLVLRNRYNLPEGQGWEHPPRGNYIRLRPGQEKLDSIALGVPVTPSTVFQAVRGNAKYAEHLALEIGFYDEDLRALILDIVEMAEKLSCDISLNSPASPSLIPNDPAMELSRRFFAGVFIARFFNLESFRYFRDSVTSGGDEIIIPYLWQTLNGEQVLRIEVDSVSIPYKSDYPPLASQAGKGTTVVGAKSPKTSGV